MTGGVSKRGTRTGCAFSGGSGGTPRGAAFAAAGAAGATAGDAEGEGEAGEAEAAGVGVGDAAFATSGVGAAAPACALVKGLQAAANTHNSATLLMIFMGSLPV
ncbi:MAG TPA: hypothetical protein VF654_07860, partial [Pyrinomonadaceae bacterium]